MANLHATKAAGIETTIVDISPRVPVTLRREWGIGNMLAVENKTALLALLLIGILGSFPLGHFRFLDVAALTGVVAMSAFVIARSVVLIARKRQYEVISITVMALLVMVYGLTRWYFWNLMNSYS